MLADDGSRTRALPVADVPPDGREAGLDAHLGDAGSHGSEADDADPFDPASAHGGEP